MLFQSFLVLVVTLTILNIAQSASFSSFDLSNQGFIAATSRTKGIFLSKNHGSTWVESLAPKIPFTEVSMSSSGSVLVGIASKHGMFVSSDHGIEWKKAVVAGNPDWKAVKVSDSGRYLFACSDNSLFRSADFGSTWEEVLDVPGNWQAVSMDSTGQYGVVVGLEEGVYVSSDYGKTWGPSSGIGVGSWVAVSCDALGRVWTVAGLSEGIYTSSDYGQNWKKSNAPDVNWRSITSDASGRYQFAAAAGSPLYVSKNFGSNWSKSKSPSKNWVKIHASQDGKGIVGTVDDEEKLYTSSDRGETWESSAAQLELAVDAKSSKQILRAFLNDKAGSSSVENNNMDSSSVRDALFTVLVDEEPTSQPTGSPTGFTAIPTHAPSPVPSTAVPTQAPSTIVPTTTAPSVAPSTIAPTTIAPSFAPSTLAPTTTAPSFAPSTLSPTTSAPSFAPSTIAPTTVAPSVSFTPTAQPTAVPSTMIPTHEPTKEPTFIPTATPSFAPTAVPTTTMPSRTPTAIPTWRPSATPTTINIVTQSPTKQVTSTVTVNADYDIANVTSTTLSQSSLDAVQLAVSYTLDVLLDTVGISGYTSTNRRLSSKISVDGGSTKFYKFKVNTYIIYDLVNYPGMNASSLSAQVTNQVYQSVASGFMTSTLVAYSKELGATELLNCTAASVSVTTDVKGPPHGKSDNVLTPGDIAAIVICSFIGFFALVALLYHYVVAANRSKVYLTVGGDSRAVVSAASEKAMISL